MHRSLRNEKTTKPDINQFELRTELTVPLSRGNSHNSDVNSHCVS